MISFLVGLTIVALCGGAVVKHLKNNPTTASAIRAQKKGKTPRRGTWTWSGNVFRPAARAAVTFARNQLSPSRREQRRAERIRKAHEKAKAKGETAATSNPLRVAAERARKTVTSGVVHDRRGLFGAMADLREAWQRRPDAAEAPAATDEPDAPAGVPHDEPAPPPPPAVAEAKPLDVRADVPCERCGRTTPVTLRADQTKTSARCPCGMELVVVRKLHEPRPDAPAADDPVTEPIPVPEMKGARVPTYLHLFETGDSIASQPFEHIFQVEAFIRSLSEGTVGVSNMYAMLAARMAGPMSIDPIVYEPVERCSAHQRAIAAAVGDADASLSVILSGTTEELLERGIRVPRPELLNGDSSSVTATIPDFFETARTLAGRTFQDVRDLHGLIKALREASDAQAQMYSRVSARLQDEGVDGSVWEYIDLAARHQRSISECLGDADTGMTRLLTMTIRELASSGLRAPNAHMIGV